MNSNLYFSSGLANLKHALAAKAPTWKPDRISFNLARPDEKYRFEFTTTSTSLLKRLGKKE